MFKYKFSRNVKANLSRLYVKSPTLFYSTETEVSKMSGLSKVN